MQPRPKFFDFFPLARAVLRVPFLTLDVIGIAMLLTGALLGASDPLAHGSFAIGGTLLTVGLSLPIAIHFQEAHNNESFELLRHSQAAGIKTLLPSRRSHELEFRKTVDRLANNTREIRFIGVAFSSLFDPNEATTSVVGRQISSPGIRIRTLLLDPDSRAARTRAGIEREGRTMLDINVTLENLLPTTIQRRLQALDEGLRQQIARQWIQSRGTASESSVVEQVREFLRFEVRLYSSDPILMLMHFDDGALVEQYHFGHPPSLVPFGGCIGQHVPVLEFRRASDAYRFWQSHFDFLWEMSRPITEEKLIPRALDVLCSRSVMPSNRTADISPL